MRMSVNACKKHNIANNISISSNIACIFYSSININRNTHHHHHHYHNIYSSSPFSTTTDLKPPIGNIP